MAVRPKQGVAAGQLVELFIEPAHLGEDSAGGLNKHEPCIGRPYAAGMAVEQTSLHNVLEFLQALGQGWLRDSERRRSREETAVRLYGVDRPQHGEPEALVEVTARHAAALARVSRELLHSLGQSVQVAAGTAPEQTGPSRKW